MAEKTILLSEHLMVDVPLADSFIKRNGIGVLRLPYGGEEREQYLKWLEKRKGLIDYS